MRQIVSPVSSTQKILGQPKQDADVSYRLTTHCMRIEQPEGVLLYHTLTGELLLLEKEEAKQLEKLSSAVPAALTGLISRRFLVPQETDEMALADLVRGVAERFLRNDRILTKYEIFTTMACNARCFYCFEAGWEKSTMSEQTALDTAKYIMAHRGGKSVRLDWFGGEPLVNMRAIDVITNYLRRQGVKFYSRMTSNGFLFDESLVQRAKADWNLQKVHISLDGTEEIYNRRKAYVSPEGSPYQRVLKNIGLLLDAGVSVRVRLNMGEGNEQDLYALMDELAERFLGKAGFGVYLVALRENAGNDPHSYTEVERRDYTQKLRSLWDYAESKGIAARDPLMYGFVTHSCIACSDSSTTVTPEGWLGRCECCRGGDVWGNVCSDERDETVLRQWRERKPAEKICKTCAVYPQCIRLKKCPAWPEDCSPIEQARRENTVHRAVLGVYEDWKAAGQN